MDLPLLTEAREEAIGGHAYMGAHPYVAYTYLTYTSCLCLLGAIGNICVLSSFAVNKKLRLAQNTFLVNLALADLVVTTIGDPLSITGKHVDTWIPKYGWYLTDDILLYIFR